MTQAVIEVDGVPGSNDDLSIDVLVLLNNLGNGGELTYSWSILDQPPGTADVLSSATIQNPTFTPKKEGTYFVQLIVNATLPDQQTNTVVCAVRQLKTRQRVPAAGETREDSIARGWAVSLNALLVQVDALSADPGVFVGVNDSGGSLSRGTVVHCASSVVIKSGLPGQETVPGFTTADANVTADVTTFLGVVESGVDGATTVLNQALMRVRALGRFANVPALSAGTVGQIVYVSDTGQLALAPGTLMRQVGTMCSISPTFDVWFDGTGSTAVSFGALPFVVIGDPTPLSNATRIDGTNATALTSSVNPTLKAGDALTIPLTLLRHESGATILRIQKSDASVDLLDVLNDGSVQMQQPGNAATSKSLGIIAGREQNSVFTEKRMALVQMLEGATNATTGALQIQVRDSGGNLRQVLSADASQPYGVAITAVPSSNGDGIYSLGDGAGAGVNAQGGATGTGVLGTGGSSSSRYGVKGVGGAPNGGGVAAMATGSGNGLDATGGSGGGSGLNATGGGSGSGVTAMGGSGGGNGVFSTGTGTGHGVVGIGGPTVAAGVEGISSGATIVAPGTVLGGHFSGAGTGGSSTQDAVQLDQNLFLAGANPAATISFKDRLTPANVPKAWANVQTSGSGGATIEDGFNVASVSVTSSAVVVTLATPMASTNYAVIPTASSGLSAVVIADASNFSIFTSNDPATAATLVMFAVFGKQ